MEATVNCMTLASALQADHQAPDDLTLFNVVATHMPDDPLPHVIQQRSEARQCLACGESSSHYLLKGGRHKEHAGPLAAPLAAEKLRRGGLLREHAGPVAAPRAAEMLGTGLGVDSRWGGTCAAPI